MENEQGDNSDKYNSLDAKAKAFLLGIEDKTQQSLVFIKTQYPEYAKLKRCMDFIHYHYLDAVKADIDQLVSVGYFPTSEAEMELDHSIKHALSGSYKSAFADLRRALELTLISVFFTSQQSTKEKAVEWIKSEKDTPFFSTMLSKITNEHHFSRFDSAQNWATNLKQFYWKLSDFSHNKGMLMGYRELNQIRSYSLGTYVLPIQTETLAKFCDYYIQTIEELVIMLILYNPVILIGLPLDEKFGLHPPMSGFYHDNQAELIHQIIPDRYKQYFSEMSINDEYINSVKMWFNSLPDLTDDEIEEQEIQDKEFWQEQAASFRANYKADS